MKKYILLLIAFLSINGIAQESSTKEEIIGNDGTVWVKRKLSNGTVSYSAKQSNKGDRLYSAIIYRTEDDYFYDGQSVRIRLEEDMRVDGVYIAEGTALVGIIKFKPEPSLEIEHILKDKKLITTSISVLNSYGYSAVQIVTHKRKSKAIIPTKVFLKIN